MIKNNPEDYVTVGMAQAKRREDWLARSAPPSAKDALQAIADLPTGDNIDVMQGQEEAYRAVEQLFSTPPHIEANPAPQTRERGRNDD